MKLTAEEKIAQMEAMTCEPEPTDKQEIKEEGSEVETVSNEIASSIVELAKSFDDIDLSGMNYVQLSALKNTATNDKGYLDHMKQMADSMKAYYTSSSEMSTVVDSIIENAPEEHKKLSLMMKDLDGFYAEYDENIGKLENAISRIDKEMEERYGSVEKTTSFITEQMIEAYEQRVTLLTTRKLKDGEVVPRNEDEIDYQKVKSTIIQITAMKERKTLPWLANKANNDGSIIRIIKEFRKDFDGNSLYIGKYLGRVFSAEEIQRAALYLDATFMNPFVTKLMLYQMAKIVRFGEEDGTAMYAKLFILNILDMMTGSYDLDNRFLADGEEPKNLFVTEVVQKFYVKYMEKLDTNTISKFYASDAGKKSKAALSRVLEKMQEIKAEQKASSNNEMTVEEAALEDSYDEDSGDVDTSPAE